MADTVSVHAQHVIDGLLTWQGAVGLAAAGVLAYTCVLSGLRSPGRGSTLLGLTAGGVKKAEVARVMDGYDKSYGMFEHYASLILKDHHVTF